MPKPARFCKAAGAFVGFVQAAHAVGAYLPPCPSRVGCAILDADMLLKALTVGFLIGFSVVGLSRAAIAALPAPETIPSITQATASAHRDVDRRVSRVTRALWATLDAALCTDGRVRLQ
jgi:hypothetical protein